MWTLLKISILCKFPLNWPFGKLKYLTQVVYIVTVENKMTLGNPFSKAFRSLEPEGHKGP